MNQRIASLLSLDGRVALVTGAATGIGEGIARVLAEAGATVAVLDIDDAGAERVAAEIVASGGKAIPRHVDVTDAEEVDRAFHELATELGTVDILVNNAGSYRRAGTIHDLSVEDWRSMLAINLDSLFYCSKAAAAHMAEAGHGGSIVNITSVDGIHPFLSVNYDTPKAGANFFTRTLALDLSPHGIRVNAIAPGLIPVETLEKMRRGELPPIYRSDPSRATGLRGPLSQIRAANIPLGRPGRVDEIGAAVLFLCSDAASYVTGQVLAVDGGWLLV